jgi:hypothetical protein
VSIEADVRALLVAASLTGIAERVYRDRAPDGEPRPYVTISADISRVPSLRGDGRTGRWKRLIQIDVWQDKAVEDLGLVDAVVAAIDGHRIATLGTTRAYVSSVQRLLEEEIELVHAAVSVGIHHP